MDNFNKEAFPKKALSAPSLKRTQDPEEDDDENYKEKKAKMNCKVKSILIKKSASADCQKITKSPANYDEDIKEQHSIAKMKGFFTDRDRLKTTPERFEEKMEGQNETYFLEVAHSLLNNILSQFPDYQSNKTASPIVTEGSIEEEQWEIISIPYSLANHPPNSDDSQNVLKIMTDDYDDNVSLADSMISYENSVSSNQQDKVSFTMQKFEQNLIPSNEFHFISAEALTDHTIDDNELIVDSTNNDVIRTSRNMQERDCFVTENHESILAHASEFSFTSSETETTNCEIINSLAIPEIKNATDTHFEKQEDIETQQQFSNGSYDELDNNNNTNSDEMGNDMNAFELLLEEIESKRFQTRSSTMAGKTRKNDVRKLMFEENTTDKHDKASTVNAISETENKSIQSTVQYEDLINRRERDGSSHADANLKRCRHSNQNSDLVIIKNKSKLGITTRKYSVTNSKGRVTKGGNEQKTKLQEFIENTLKDTHPDLHLKDNITQRLEIFLWDMLHRIGDEAETLVTLSTKKFFDKRVLKYAIKLCLEKLKTEADVVSGKRNQWFF